jgi:NitT/TauT family transport system permease protein
MGASPWFLVRRVPVPAAMPSVFVGLFMGLGASFSVLVVAEMLGLTASSEASRRDRRETPATSRSPRWVEGSPIADATPDRTVLMAIAK